MIREEIEHALRRCSVADREAVLSEFDYLERMVNERVFARRRDATLVGDQRKVIADQRRHIANLEAQLLPYLTGQPDAEQEAML